MSEFVMKGGEKEIMKALIKRKTSALVAFFMIASMLLPIAAFAAEGFANLVHNAYTGKVTGSVYTTAYEEGATPDVRVYDKNGNHLNTSVQVTYVNYRDVEGNYYYNVTADVAAYGSTYFPLNFRYFYDTANSSVYEGANVAQGFTAPPIFGGGGFGNTGSELTANADGSVSASALQSALADGTATIAISGDVALLPASALTADGVVTIVADGASYELLLSELNLEELAKELGVDLGTLTISITVAELTGTAKANAEAAVKTVNGEVIGGIIEFKVEAVAGDKKVEVNNFSKFIKRTIELTGTASNAVAVRITGDSVASVPTSVYDNEAALYSKSNSVYTVINVEAKTFADLAGHWSQEEVETLASKLIVEGTGANQFEPKRAITRAEFATMIVRALGLEANGSTDKFSDVASSAWYAGAVAAAAEAGIVQGDTAGTFRPSAVITRQELAAMVVRAMNIAGKEVTLTDAQVSAALAPFADADKLGWAKAEVAAAVSAGIIEGQSATSVAPLANANRAEASAMVLRLLTNVGFIN